MVTFAKSITEGNTYEPISQTKSGFLIEDDEGVEIDLYHHFFRFGIKTGNNIEWVPLRAQIVEENPVSEAPLPTAKEEPKTQDLKKAAPKKEEVKKDELEEEDDFSIAELNASEEDDFSISGPEESPADEEEEDDFSV